MKELDEARKQIRLAIGRSCDYEYRRKFLQDKNGNVRPMNDVGAEQILNLSGNGWKIAIIKDQGLIGSFVIDKQEPKFYQEVIWNGGDK